MSHAADLCPDCCEHVVWPVTTEPTATGVCCVYSCPCGHTWSTSWALPISELEATP